MITAIIILSFLASFYTICYILFVSILWIVYKSNGGKHGLIWYIINWR